MQCYMDGLNPMQVSYVKRQLKAMDFHKRETKTASKFTQCYLRRDGLLIVRLIGELYCFSFVSNTRNVYTNLVVDKEVIGFLHHQEKMQGTWWLLNSFMDYGQITDQTDGVWLSHRARQLPRVPGSSRTSLYDTTFQGFAVVHISLVYVSQAAQYLCYNCAQ